MFIGRIVHKILFRSAPDEPLASGLPRWLLGVRLFGRIQVPLPHWQWREPSSAAVLAADSEWLGLKQQLLAVWPLSRQLASEGALPELGLRLTLRGWAAASPRSTMMLLKSNEGAPLSY